MTKTTELGPSAPLLRILSDVLPTKMPDGWKPVPTEARGGMGFRAPDGLLVTTIFAKEGIDRCYSAVITREGNAEVTEADLERARNLFFSKEMKPVVVKDESAVDGAPVRTVTLLWKTQIIVVG